MNVAFLAPPLAGHLNPLRALALELVARGHRAVLVGRPDAAAHWRAPGLEFVPVAQAEQPRGSIDASVAALAGRGPFAFAAMLREVARATDLLCAHAPDALRALGADLVVADQAEAGGGFVAARCGLPWVTAATALPLDRDADVPPPWRDWAPDPTPAGRRANRVRWRVADLLMRPVDAVLARHARRAGIAPRPAHGWRSPHATLAQLVAGLDFPRGAPPPGWATLGPWREPDDAIAECALRDERRPLAFCSFGTMRGDRLDLFDAVCGACAELGLAPVVAHGGRLAASRARSLPGAPIVRDTVPQRAVLARCAVAIVHGGLNTVLDALAAGVPMVVLPLGFEQPGTAARLRHAGVAEVVPAARADRARLRAAIARALAGPHRARAAVLAGEIGRSGGVRAAVDRIEAAGGAAAAGAQRAARPSRAQAA
jgi:zeaxanthin glucosyltransferase